MYGLCLPPRLWVGTRPDLTIAISGYLLGFMASAVPAIIAVAGTLLGSSMIDRHPDRDRRRILHELPSEEAPGAAKRMSARPLRMDTGLSVYDGQEDIWAGMSHRWRRR